MQQNKATFDQKACRFFDEADKNDDGKVSRLELCKRLMENGYGGTVEDVADMFCDLNTDNDDCLSREEFMNGLQGVSPKEVTKKQLMAEFCKIDVDKSGFITKDELIDALTRCNMDPENASLEALDENDDGKVSEQEFLQMFDERN